MSHEIIKVDLEEDSPDTTQEFISRLPPILKEGYSKIPPELHLLSEKELVQQYKDFRKDEWGNPHSEGHETDKRLRISFWFEYDASIFQKRRMTMLNIFNGICNQSLFYSIVRDKPHRLAFIMIRPPSYEVANEDLLNRFTERLYEIAKAPTIVKICRCLYFCICRPPGVKPQYKKKEDCACFNGCLCPTLPNTKMMEVVLKAKEAVELRAKGSIPQVIKQQNTNLNLHGKVPEKLSAPPKSVNELERELEVLRAQKAKLLAGEAPAAGALTQEVNVIEGEVIE